MALQTSGPISLSDVNVELGLSGTSNINLDQSTVRTLFGVASGQISLYDGYGKSSYVPPLNTYRAIFAYGEVGNTAQPSAYYLVSNTGVMSSQVTSTNPARYAATGASYGGDKGCIAYGFGAGGTGYDLVSNTGVLASTTGLGGGSSKQDRQGATYGYDKAIFAYGQGGGNYLVVANRLSNTGVMSSDTSVTDSTFRVLGAGTSYGGGKAIIAFGRTQNAFGTISYINTSIKISDTGVMAATTAGVGTSRAWVWACTFGGYQGIFGGGLIIPGGQIGATNIVSNTGVVASDVTRVGNGRHSGAAAGYGTDKGISSFGIVNGVYLTNQQLISNTGVCASETSTVAPGRGLVAASSYGSS